MQSFKTMQLVHMLKMIDEGRFEELKKMLQDEIYQEELKNKPGSRQRYSAMKRYFKYTNSSRVICQKPATIEFEGREVTSFCNSYSLALTTESPGSIELFTDDDGNYPDVGRLVKRNGKPELINLDMVIADAKSKGYKLTKSEVNKEKYLMYYNGAYFRMGLIHATYAIIADGRDITAYHDGGSTSPLTLENDLGLCLILPVKCDESIIEQNRVTVIDVK